MYISIDNYDFKIRLSKVNTPIHIEDRKSDTYTLCVPVNFRDKELQQYLKTNAKNLVKAFEKKNIDNTIIHIQLYNKAFLHVYKPNCCNAYRDEKRIYSSLSTKAVGSIKKITKEVFLWDVKTMIGLWEERLSCLVENTYLKNYKTKSFKICHQSSTIELSIHLMDHHYSYIEFVVAKAVFHYLKLDNQQQDILMEKYVKDYKQSNKVFEHERGKPI